MSRHETLNGAITGIAIAAASHWARYDDDTQRRLRNVRLDVEEALDLIRDMQSRADVVRSRLPTVLDAQVGLSIASPQPAPASVVPSTAPLSRPDLTTQLETAVAEMAWPPTPGQYDDRGMVKQAGELTSMFLAMTYEENRAFFQGLAQSRPPSREAKVQIALAANALVAQLYEQKLTWQQYKEAWGRLLGGGAKTPSNPVDVHADPTRPPMPVGTFAVGVTSVVPLSSQSLPGYPYANRNTDTAMRFRLNIGASSINSGQQLCTIQFGSEYRTRDAQGQLIAAQPVVLVNSALNRLYADAITPTGFSLFNAAVLPANTSVDVFLSARCE